jgi:hypothetical protein
MKIWRLDSDVNYYENLIPIKEEDWDKLLFRGKNLADEWTPVPVRILEESKASDSPGLDSSAPVFSEKAVEMLKDLIDSSVEILPVRCRKGNYFAINVVNVIDCVDYSNSIFKTFKNSKKIMLFEKYSFIPERVEGKNIFKIVDEPTKRAFVSDVFRELVLSSGLTGFKFDLGVRFRGEFAGIRPIMFFKVNIRQTHATQESSPKGLGSLFLH